jgi:RNA polymerase sigma-70 factor (ECF subfamily)
MDDSELIRNWQTGGHQAFAALVRRWQGPIGRFLYHLVRRKETVGDLSQEVFLRVFQARNRYRDNGNFSAWLYQIAVNVVRSDGRKKQQRGLLSLEGEQIKVSLPSPLGVCEQQEVCSAVSQAVDELPEPLRLVVVLRHYQELNFEEMSRILHIPASTLKSRFASALRHLRQSLASLERNTEE